MFRSGWLVFACAAFPLVTAACAGEPPGNEPPIEAKPAGSTQANSRERAEQELKSQQKQRILGIIPNFNTSNAQDAAALSGRQKFHLALRSAGDPFSLVAAGLSAGLEQRSNAYPEYGQGGQGYAKRFGAAYVDNFSGTIFGGAVFPILLHQDPRYFRKGTGSFRSRLFYSVSMTVKAKSDSGRWVPNYSNILGNLAAGAIANTYYPPSDRGAGLTVERALTVTALGSLGSIMVEFWPDIAAKLSHKH